MESMWRLDGAPGKDETDMKNEALHFRAVAAFGAAFASIGTAHCGFSTAPRPRV
jgi:hypothetical protein